MDSALSQETSSARADNNRIQIVLAAGASGVFIIFLVSFFIIHCRQRHKRQRESTNQRLASYHNADGNINFNSNTTADTEDTLRNVTSNDTPDDHSVQQPATEADLETEIGEAPHRPAPVVLRNGISVHQSNESTDTLPRYEDLLCDEPLPPVRGRGVVGDITLKCFDGNHDM
jgi:hypothetical protein